MSKFLSKLLGSSGSSTELAAALETAQGDLEIADQAVRTTELAYQRGLLDETPAALRKLVDAKTDAGISADRARAVIARLESNLEAALTTEEEARRQERYDRAKGLADAARKQLFSGYVEAAEQICTVLRAIADADIAADVANEDLPQGASRIDKPDVHRQLPNRPREVTSETLVSLWSGEGDTNPLPDDLQKRVTDYGKSASVRTDSGGTLRVVRRTYNRIEFLPEQHGRYLMPLSSEVSLPALAFGQSPFFEPCRTPSETLRQLDLPRRPAEIDQPRETEIEYSLVRD